MLRDNAERQRYEYEADGVRGYVSYRRGAGVTTLSYARVPDAAAGRGIGSKMARAVLEELRARGERVIATCPFIAEFIDRNPEFRPLLEASDRP